MINEKQAYGFNDTLKDLGFKDFFNKYAPFSRFFTLDKKSKTLYVRRDIERKYGKYYFAFEVWVRDNKKSVFAKDQDTHIFMTAKNENLITLRAKILSAAGAL